MAAINSLNADSLTRGFEFELEPEESSKEIEDGEQDLDHEAGAMLRAWNKNQILKEVADMKRKQQLDEARKLLHEYDGETDFCDIMKTMEPICGDEVYLKIITPNPTGKQIKGSHTILFDRVGYIEHDCNPFESTLCDGKPSKVSLLVGPLIPGLLSALLSLREGEAANVIIKPSKAYGSLGCPPVIPEEASLFYNIKIHKVWEESQLNEILDYERQHHCVADTDEKLAVIEEHRQIANQYLKDDDAREALIRYKAAIQCMDDMAPDFIQNNPSITKTMIILLQNASIAYNKLGMHKSATKYAKRALSFDPTSLKAYYQLIKARISLSDFDKAVKFLNEVDQIAPKCAIFNPLRLELSNRNLDERLKRDEVMRKMSRAFN